MGVNERVNRSNHLCTEVPRHVRFYIRFLRLYESTTQLSVSRDLEVSSIPCCLPFLPSNHSLVTDKIKLSRLVVPPFARTICMQNQVQKPV
jgi:hypothetical protein